jgi:hypothetical protein
LKIVDKFKEFAKSGLEIKNQIDNLVDSNKFEEAVSLAREKLAICQNFMREFSNKSTYYSTLEIIVNDINSLIDTINKKSSQNKKVGASSEKKYHRTKILNEDVLENASKLVESSINFNDFVLSSTGFLSAFTMFKNKPDVFYNYLVHIGHKAIQTIYKNVEMPYDILIGIINCLKTNLR